MTHPTTPPIQANPEPPTRLLVVMPTWLGDCVMATPTLRALRKRWPEDQTHITALITPAMRPVLNPCPFVDALTTDLPRRSDAYDTALLLRNSFRSAWWAYRAGIPRRIGYNRDARGWMLTHRLDAPRDASGWTPVPTLRYYLDLAALLGVDPDAADPAMTLSTAEAHDRDADRLLTDLGLADVLPAPRPADTRALVLLNPGGNREDKRWPATRFAQLADALDTRYPGRLRFAVTGSPNEAHVLEEVAQRARCGVVNLLASPRPSPKPDTETPANANATSPTPTMSLALLKSVVRRAALLITNDTGPRHLAAALGTPAVSLFGPTPLAWTVIDADDEITLEAPDGVDPDTGQTRRQGGTMRAITVTSVLEAAEKLLARRGRLEPTFGQGKLFPIKPHAAHDTDANGTPRPVAIFCEKFDPRGGGAERSTLQIAEELVHRGHSVTVYAGSAPARCDLIPGLWVEPYRRKASSSVFRLIGYQRWATRQREALTEAASLSITMAVPADVVQPRGGTVRETLIRTAASRGGGWRTALKSILSQLDPKQRALLYFEAQTIRDPAVRCFVAVSDYVAEQFREHYGVDANRVEVIPNAAVIPNTPGNTKTTTAKTTTAKSSKTTTDDARVELRAALGVDEATTLFLFAAAVPMLKGYRPLLRAVARLTRAGTQPGREFLVLVAGPLEHRGVKEAVRMGPAVRERFRFLGRTDAIDDLYRACDATVLPTYYDPASKVVIESLMHGRPAITTRFNGAAAQLLDEHGQPHRGEVIDNPDDDAALAHAMARMIDPDQRAAYAAQCDGLADTLAMREHVDRLAAVLFAKPPHPTAPATEHHERSRP